MPVLAVSGERKLTRYKDQDIDASYIAGQKLYGRNLWRLVNQGANDFGTSTVETMDGFTVASNLSQHYKFTVASLASNIWSRTFQGLYPNGTATSYDLNKDYTTSFWIKPSLNKFRLYIYLGILGNTGTNYANFLVNVTANEWNKITYTRKPSGQDGATSNRNLIGFRYLQSDHVGANLIGQTLEIKEVKTEEGELSPYSVNVTLL